jgi:hypothetical protein
MIQTPTGVTFRSFQEATPCENCGRFDYARHNYTSGGWATEAESVAAFDEVVESLGMFRIYREVEGHYPQPRLGTPRSSARIDRILVPRAELYAAGWTLGPIGVECKRSDEKVGRPFSQLLDYSRATWLLEPDKDIWIALKWLFLWPMGSTGGPLASILAQHRLGGVEPTHGSTLTFFSGGQRVAVFKPGEPLHMGAAANGSKVGSR